jgi:hypothetical protein
MKNKERVKKIVIHPIFFGLFLQEGNIHKVTNGLPRGARVIRSDLKEEYCNKTFELIIEHESFELVDMNKIPEIEIEFKRIYEEEYNGTAI